MLSSSSGRRSSSSGRLSSSSGLTRGSVAPGIVFDEERRSVMARDPEDDGILIRHVRRLYDTRRKPSCQPVSNSDNMGSMTSFEKTPRRSRTKPAPPPAHWLLQDAKARFSELVRRVRGEGPQHVTVHGRDEVVVISAEEYRRLKGDRTGAALIAVMRDSPHRDIAIEPKRAAFPVRDVIL